MGGVGIASRNNRMINYLNPAAVTARDTLSFMLDFGVSGEGKMYQQGDVKSANNLFNIYDFMFTVPVYRSSAFIAGITPYSSLGYDFSHDITDKDLIAGTGNINYRSLTWRFGNMNNASKGRRGPGGPGHGPGPGGPPPMM